MHDLSYISHCLTIDEVQETYIKSNKTINIINEIRNKFGDKIEKFLMDERNKTVIFNYKYINSSFNHFLSNLLESEDLNNLIKYGFKIKELEINYQGIAQYNLEEIECGNKNIIFMLLSPTMRQLLLWKDKRIELDQEGKSNLP